MKTKYRPKDVRVTFTDPETGEEHELTGFDVRQHVIPLACSGPGRTRIVTTLTHAEEGPDGTDA
jgi:hypothetical protein